MISSGAAVVAWAGLGAMGRPLAANLMRASSLVSRCLVWNRTVTRAQEHSETHKTEALESLNEVVRQRPRLLFTCLPNSQVVSSVLDSILSDLHPDTIVVDCTSGNPIATQQLGKRLREERDVTLIDAPVSGGPRGAQAGKLSVIVGGPDAEVQVAWPFLDVFAKQVTHVGPLGAGHAVKAVNNYLNSTHLLAASEGVAVLAKLGVEPGRALDAINQSSGRSLMTMERLPEEVLTGRYEYGFKLGLMEKDVGHAVDMLDSVYPQGRFMRITHNALHESVEKYGFDVDYTYLAKLIQDESGAVLETHEESS